MAGPSRAARLVAWSNAVLAGAASPDLAAARVAAGDPPHRVHDVPAGAVETLPVLLARLGARGGRPEARLLLPVPGDPVGLHGPRALATAALDAGAAAVLPGAHGTSVLV